MAEESHELVTVEGYRINPELERSFDRKISSNGWSLKYSGAINTADPVTDRISLRSGDKPVVVHYNLSQLVIGNKRSLNLLDILPGDWNITSIAPASLHQMAPEILEGIQRFEHNDLGNKRIILGSVEDESITTAQKWCRMLLWDVLIARIVEETGLAGNEAAMKTQTDLVGSRIEEILKALKGEIDADPKEIALKPFAH